MELRRTSNAVLITTVISVFLLLLVHRFDFFNLLDLNPREYSKEDLLEVKVKTLTSLTTQLPYPYYSLPYCLPPNLVNSTVNLGEILHGDPIQNSPYLFRMREPQTCNVVCRLTLDAKTAKEFKEKVENDYRVNMILDNLPLLVPIHISIWEPVFYRLGFHVGLKGSYDGGKEKKYFIYNHLAFTVKYHKDLQTDLSMIVGFEVKPFSVQHEYEGIWNEKTLLKTCDPNAKQTVMNSNSLQEVEEKKEIIFTYDVEFQESDTKWTSRWDVYVHRDNQLHWFSVISSLTIVLFLSGMIAMIILRTVYTDVSKYNELENKDKDEETGWKVVHRDVFWPPSNPDIFCVCVGSGVQLLGTIPVTLMLAILGIFSPSNRGGLRTTMLLIWVSMGYFAGYASTRLHKIFGGSEWKKIALWTALVFPSIILTIFFGLNMFMLSQTSPVAMLGGTMNVLVFLWLGISVPLAFIGGYFGFKKPAIEDPVVTKKVPRQIPEQSWYVNSFLLILVGGVFPFVIIFVEFFYALISTWFHEFYSISAFHILVFIVFFITCAEVTIVLCYVKLRSEDYLWWWRSYFTSGASALYLFLYATFFFFTKFGSTSMITGIRILYFGYMLIASLTFFVLSGTIGFYACFWFTRLIYSSPKID
ncbi:hypothetical protein SLEP1_g1782 [Rubroshorea leprosula]|uniref:Transmembrane 9 superfamily member n=1 Tax=Rubroshorea leprosula TaxID=152421 RepID=A0AAV5HNP7_9ROSI|nr:hypothetical protein SLEP1_g1782 [Rubroshorea leprosula]